MKKLILFFAATMMASPVMLQANGVHHQGWNRYAPPMWHPANQYRPWNMPWQAARSYAPPRAVYQAPYWRQPSPTPYAGRSQQFRSPMMNPAASRYNAPPPRLAYNRPVQRPYPRPYWMQNRKPVMPMHAYAPKPVRHMQMPRQAAMNSYRFQPRAAMPHQRPWQQMARRAPVMSQPGVRGQQPRQFYRPNAGRQQIARFARPLPYSQPQRFAYRPIAQQRPVMMARQFPPATYRPWGNVNRTMAARQPQPVARQYAHMATPAWQQRPEMNPVRFNRPVSRVSYLR